MCYFFLQVTDFQDFQTRAHCFGKHPRVKNHYQIILFSYLTLSFSGWSFCSGPFWKAIACSINGNDGVFQVALPHLKGIWQITLSTPWLPLCQLAQKLVCLFAEADNATSRVIEMVHWRSTFPAKNESLQMCLDSGSQFHHHLESFFNFDCLKRH